MYYLVSQIDRCIANQELPYKEAIMSVLPFRRGPRSATYRDFFSRFFPSLISQLVRRTCGPYLSFPTSVNVRPTHGMQDRPKGARRGPEDK